MRELTVCRKSLLAKCFFALTMLLGFAGNVMAQTDTKVSINVNDVLIRTVLEQLQRETKIHFVYDEENIDKEKE